LGKTLFYSAFILSPRKLKIFLPPADGEKEFFDSLSILRREPVYFSREIDFYS
jgi:hypothetical protein